MPRVNLTDRFCRTVTVEEATDYRDSKVGGLELRVAPPGRRSSEGVRSWRVTYRLPGSRKKHAYKIGRFPDVGLAEARATARNLFATIARGEDPKHNRQAATRRRERTLKALWSDYMRLHVAIHNRHRTSQDKQQAFATYIEPALGSWPISEVDRPMLEEFLVGLAQKGTSTQRKVHRYLSSCFGFALERGDIAHNPFTSMKAPKPAPPRERVLSDEEIRAFWWSEVHAVYVPMLRFTLLTGARFGNVKQLSWQQLDLNQRLWSIPAQAFKTGKPHHVPLSDLAIDVLEAIPRWEAGDFVFTTRGGEKPFGNVGKTHAKLLQATATSGWHRHDVRRTAGTILQRSGFPLEVVAAFLGHKLQGVTAIYLRHDYALEKRKAAAELASVIARNI